MTTWKHFDGDDEDDTNGENGGNPSEPSDTVPYDDIGARIGEGSNPAEDAIL